MEYGTFVLIPSFGYLGIVIFKFLVIMYSSKRGKKYIKKAMNKSEFNYVDTYSNTTVTTSGITPICLNAIATGTDVGTRVGREIILKSISGRFGIQCGDSTNFVRIVIVYDISNNGTIPAVSDILETGDYRSDINYDNLSRFKVIYDNFFGLSLAGSGAMVDKFYKRVSNLTTTYNNTTAYTTTPGDVNVTGSLWLLLISDSSAIPNPGVYYFVRVKYTNQ